jgi:cobalamin biosynthesis protein CobD/CbiB
MTAAIVVTIVVVVLTVLVLALYLLKIALMLRSALSALRTVNKSLKAIPSKVEPVEPLLKEMTSDLDGARGQLEDLLSRERPPAATPADTLRPPGPGTVA